MNRRSLSVATCVAAGCLVVVLAASAQDAAGPPASLSPAAREVWHTESAFAKTMADRSHTGFVSFLAEDAVFLGRVTHRGKAAVADAWRAYYESPAAPFSWKPERVEVLDSGTLAFSTGPVFSPAGARTGTFMSVWRKEADGTWRIVFDTGCPPCGP